MYNCSVIIANKDDWLNYINTILVNSNNSNANILENIMDFPFKFAVISI